MTLTSANALDMIRASQERAKELGINISTAIVDAEGRLFAFARMDSTHWSSIEVSQAKAYTGAILRREGQQIREMDPEIVAAIGGVHHRMLRAAGSVTVLRDNERVVGAVGCSGGSDEQDGECAHAARDAYRS